MKAAGSHRAFLAAALAAGLVVQTGPAAAARDDLETRVSRLERVLDSQTLVEMATRIDELQNELAQLRGEVEVLSRKVEENQRGSRELSNDLDRRLSGTANPPPAPVAPPVNGSGAPAAPATPPPAASTLSEQEAYQKAIGQLRELHYGPAIEGFRSYLRQYPNGQNAPSAQYWLGEAYYTQRDFKQAIPEYQRLIASHPQSGRVAEAMLKIGQSQYELGDYAAAQKSLNELVSRYPNSTEAGQARSLLQKLRR